MKIIDGFGREREYNQDSLTREEVKSLILDDVKPVENPMKMDVKEGPPHASKELEVLLRKLLGLKLEKELNDLTNAIRESVDANKKYYDRKNTKSKNIESKTFEQILIDKLGSTQKGFELEGKINPELFLRQMNFQKLLPKPSNIIAEPEVKVNVIENEKFGINSEVIEKVSENEKFSINNEVIEKAVEKISQSLGLHAEAMEKVTYFLSNFISDDRQIKTIASQRVKENKSAGPPDFIKMANGGIVPGPRVKKDIVPAMIGNEPGNIKPGSFILRRDAADYLAKSSPALLMPGERIIPPDEVNQIGLNKLNHFNKTAKLDDDFSFEFDGPAAERVSLYRGIAGEFIPYSPEAVKEYKLWRQKLDAQFGGNAVAERDWLKKTGNWGRLFALSRVDEIQDTTSNVDSAIDYAVKNSSRNGIKPPTIVEIKVPREEMSRHLVSHGFGMNVNDVYDFPAPVFSDYYRETGRTMSPEEAKFANIPMAIPLEYKKGGLAQSVAQLSNSASMRSPKEAKDWESLVVSHEQIHQALGGKYAGIPRYSYKLDSNGMPYKAEGEIPFDITPVNGDPEQTIAKMNQIVNALMGPSILPDPAGPSEADHKLANKALGFKHSAMSNMARMNDSSNNLMALQQPDSIKFSGADCVKICGWDDLLKLIVTLWINGAKKLEIDNADLNDLIVDELKDINKKMEELVESVKTIDSIGSVTTGTSKRNRRSTVPQFDTTQSAQFDVPQFSKIENVAEEFKPDYMKIGRIIFDGITGSIWETVKIGGGLASALSQKPLEIATNFNNEMIYPVAVNIGKYLNAAGALISEKAIYAGNSIIEGASYIGDKATYAGRVSKIAALSIGNAIVGMANSITSAAIDSSKKVGAKIGEWIAPLGTAALSIGNEIVGISASIATAVVDNSRKVGAKIGEWTAPMGAAILDGAKIVGAEIGEWTAPLGKAISGVKNYASKNVSNAVEYYQEKIGELGGWFGNAWEKISKPMKDAIGKVRGELQPPVKDTTNATPVSTPYLLSDKSIGMPASDTIVEKADKASRPSKSKTSPGNDCTCEEILKKAFHDEISRLIKNLKHINVHSNVNATSNQTNNTTKASAFNGMFSGMFKVFSPLKGWFAGLSTDLKERAKQTAENTRTSRYNHTNHDRFLVRLGEALTSDRPVQEALGKLEYSGKIGQISRSIADRTVRPIAGARISGFAGGIAEDVASLMLRPIQRELDYFQNIRQTLAQTEGVTVGTRNDTREQESVLQQYAITPQDIARSGQNRSELERNQIRLLQRGIRDTQKLNAVSVAGLNAARMLGSNAEQTAELFADMHQSLQLTTNELGQMGMNFRDISRQTGVTGDQLIKVVRQSEQFMKNMQRSGTFNSSAGRNITQLMAEATTTGTTEAMQRLLGTITNNMLVEGGDPGIRNLLYAAAGNQRDPNVIRRLQNNTITQDRGTMRQLMGGLDSYLRSFTGGRNVEDLDNDTRAMIDTALRNANNIGINELQMLIRAGMQGTRSFSERYEQTRTGPANTPTQMLRRQEQLSSMAETQLMEYLNLFANNLRGAGTGVAGMQTAMQRFNANLPTDFAADLNTLNINGGQGANNQAISQMLTTVITATNTRLRNLNLGDQAIQNPATAIEEALASPSGMEGLIARITEMSQMAATRQRRLEDPISQIEDTTRKIENHLRKLVENFLIFMGRYTGLALTQLEASEGLAAILEGNFVDAFRFIGRDIGNMIQNIELGLEGLEPSLNENVLNSLRRIWNGVKPIFEGVSQFLENLSVILSGDFDQNNVNKMLSGLGKAITTGLFLYFKGFNTIILGATGDLLQELGNNLQGELGLIVKALGKGLSAIGDVAGGIIDVIVGVFDKDDAKIDAGIDKIKAGLKKAAQFISEAVWRVFKEVPAIVAEALANLPERVATPLRFVWKLLEPAVNGIADIFGGLNDILENGFSEDKLIKIFKGLGKVVLTAIAGFAVYALTTGLVGIITTALAAVPALIAKGLAALAGAIAGSTVLSIGAIFGALVAIDKMGLIEKAITALDALPEWIADPLRRILKIVEPITKLAGRIFDGLWDAVEGAMEGDSNKVWNSLGKALSSGLALVITGVVVSMAGWPALIVGGLAILGKPIEAFGNWLKQFGPWGNVFGSMLSVLGKGLQGLGNVLQGIIDIIYGLFTWDTNKIRDGWDSIKAGFMGMWTSFLEAARTWPAKIRAAFTSINWKDLGKNFAGWLKGLFSPENIVAVGNLIAENWQGILWGIVIAMGGWAPLLGTFFLGLISEIIAGIATGIGEFIEGFGDEIANSFPAIGTWISTIGIAFQAIGSIFEGISDIVSGIFSLNMDQIGTGLLKMLGGVGALLLTGIELMLFGWLAPIELIGESILSLIEGIFGEQDWINDIRAGWKALTKGIHGWFTWLYDFLIGHSIIPDLINGIAEWFEKLPEWIKNSLAKLGLYIINAISGWLGGGKFGSLNEFGTWLKSKWDEWIKTPLNNFGIWIAEKWDQWIMTPLSDFGTWVATKWDEWIKTPLNNFGTWIVGKWDEWIQTPLNAAGAWIGTNILTPISNMGNIVGNALNSIREFFTNIGRNIWEWVRTNMPDINGIGTNLSNTVSGWWRNASAVAGNAINAAWNWIRGLPGRIWSFISNGAMRGIAEIRDRLEDMIWGLTSILPGEIPILPARRLPWPLDDVTIGPITIPSMRAAIQGGITAAAPNFASVARGQSTTGRHTQDVINSSELDRASMGLFNASRQLMSAANIMADFAIEIPASRMEDQVTALARDRNFVTEEARLMRLVEAATAAYRPNANMADRTTQLNNIQSAAANLYLLRQAGMNLEARTEGGWATFANQARTFSEANLNTAQRLVGPLGNLADVFHGPEMSNSIRAVLTASPDQRNEVINTQRTVLRNNLGTAEGWQQLARFEQIIAQQPEVVNGLFNAYTSLHALQRRTVRDDANTPLRGVAGSAILQAQSAGASTDQIIQAVYQGWQGNEGIHGMGASAELLQATSLSQLQGDYAALMGRLEENLRAAGDDGNAIYDVYLEMMRARTTFRNRESELAPVNETASATTQSANMLESIEHHATQLGSLYTHDETVRLAIMDLQSSLIGVLLPLANAMDFEQRMATHNNNLAETIERGSITTSNVLENITQRLEMKKAEELKAPTIQATLPIPHLDPEERIRRERLTNSANQADSEELERTADNTEEVAENTGDIADQMAKAVKLLTEIATALKGSGTKGTKRNSTSNNRQEFFEPFSDRNILPEVEYPEQIYRTAGFDISSDEHGT